MSLVSVILININDERFVVPCLGSLHHWIHKTPLDVIVIDNASTDGSGDRLGSQFPWIRVIQSDTRLGFGAACNLGAQNAQGDLLLFLNTDTLAISDFVSPLVNCLQQDPDIGIIAPQLVFEDGTFQLSAGSLPSIAVELRDKVLYALARQTIPGLKKLISQPYQRIQSVGWVTGACLLMRRTAFDHIGGFDEGFFLYFEDKDLCLRTALAGWKVLYNPTVSLIHYLGGGTRSFRSEWHRKLYRQSQVYYYQKHLDPLQQWLLTQYLKTVR